MKALITVTGTVLVEDIIGALFPESVEVPAYLAGRESERLEFDDVEVGVERALDALDEGDHLETLELTDRLSQDEVVKLAEAVRCGDVTEAERSLDALLGNEPTLREWIDRGRYSKKARDAKAAAAIPLRGHTAEETGRRLKVA